MIINPYLFGVAYDADAQAFFTAAGITDNTQKTAVNQLVLDLKSYSIWSKMKALYPMVGGTATTHSYNLKNTASYQLTFNGGWTHSSNGALPNGTNAYANTGLVPTSVLTDNSTHLAYYSRTNNASGDTTFIGMTNSFAYQMRMQFYSNTFYVDQYDGYTGRSSVAQTDSRGLFLGSRTASNVQKMFRNGSQIGTTLTTDSGDFSKINANLYLAANNINNSSSAYSNHQCALASIGDGLSDTESANFYTAIQAFQTTLSRNV